MFLLILCERGNGTVTLVINTENMFSVDTFVTRKKCSDKGIILILHLDVEKGFVF